MRYRVTSRYTIAHYYRTDRIENRWWNVAHTSALGSANARVEWAEANICVLHLDLIRAFLPGRRCREKKEETDRL